MYRISRTFLLSLVAASGFLFSAMSQAQITLNVSPVDTGTVNIAGVTEIDYRQNCRDSCVTYSATDTQGGSATFTASPDTGYQFLGWTVDGSPQGSNLVLVLGPYPSVIPPTTLTATFETIPQNTDSDNDGVYDDADQCPSTPQGESVDSRGCGLSQKDDDGDTVANNIDRCPATPRYERVDRQGCGASQKDGDSDGVSDADDVCPATPANDDPDAEGCGATQRDTDTDGVNDASDLCPVTPADDDPDAEGCGATQRDTDTDGVNDASDLCPATAENDAVDADGCADTQKDTDSDGVNDALDQCSDTQPGEPVDENGCSYGQRDDDGDGIANAIDECIAPPGNKAVNTSGCTVVQEKLAELGEDLADLDGLTEEDQSVAGAIDDACPRLIIEGDDRPLTPGQEDLAKACRNLKSVNSDADQQVAALSSISPQLLSNRTDSVIETASRHHQQLTQRLSRIKSGGGRGVSLAGLSLNFAGEALPGALLEEAADQAGMGDLGPDFGNWGIYLQGDLDVTERRDTDSRRQYDEDAWLVTLGADYRFSPQLYAGLALSLGETETEYADARSDTETNALTLYGGWQFSDAGFLDVQLGWADDDYDMSRQVAYVDAGGSFSSDYRGATGGDHMTAAVNLGYMLNTAGWRLGPTASYFYLDGEVDAYKETASEGSSKAWELAVDGNRFEKSILRLGLQADYAWLTDFGVLVPGVMLHFVSESNSGDTATSTLLANDLEGFGQQITIQREILDGQYWDVSFNLAGQFSYGFSGFASYRITAARDGYQHRGYTLGLRWDQAF